MTLFVERIDYESGEMYDGEWNEDGRRHGKGCLTFKDGSKYRGQFTAGFFQVESIAIYVALYKPLLI